MAAKRGEEPLDSARLDGDFLALLNEYRGAVHRVCRNYANGIDDREELLHEIVYQLWRAFPSYRREAAPALDALNRQGSPSPSEQQRRPVDAMPSFSPHRLRAALLRAR